MAADETIAAPERNSETVEGDTPPHREIIGPVVQGRSGNSFGSLLISAILGGVIALGGASLIGPSLQGVPVVGGLFAGTSQTGEPAIADLSARIDTLAGQVDALRTVDAGAVQEALTLAQTASENSQKTSAEIEALNRQIIESGTGAPVDMEALKAAIAGDAAQLTERVAALEAAGESSGTSEIRADLTAIREQLTRLDSLQGTDEQIRTSMDAIGERLSTLEATINQNVLPSMESVQEAAGAAVESQKVARSVSARALGSVLENGGTFAGELAAAEALVGETENIAALRELATKGILSKEALAGKFAEVSNAVLSVEEPDAEGLGVMDKLFASARSLVKVRPAGPVEGDTVGAIVSRISAALAAGNIAEAVAEWNSLPEDAKTVSAEWHRQAQERLDAQDRLNTIIGELGMSSPNQG